jgi:hypothetical protein
LVRRPDWAVVSAVRVVRLGESMSNQIRAWDDVSRDVRDFHNGELQPAPCLASGAIRGYSFTYFPDSESPVWIFHPLHESLAGRSRRQQSAHSFLTTDSADCRPRLQQDEMLGRRRHSSLARMQAANRRAQFGDQNHLPQGRAEQTCGPESACAGLVASARALRQFSGNWIVGWGLRNGNEHAYVLMYNPQSR